MTAPDQAKLGDGGPAFPATCMGDPGHPASIPGMSLRDWFAGQALVGCIMDRASWGVNHSDNAADFARYAFDIADAMIRARAAAEPSTTGDAS